MHENETDIALITEIKPKFTQDPTTAQQLCIDGYDLFTNIEKVAVRGIAIYVHSSLSKFVTDIGITVQLKEYIWLKLRIRGNDALIIGCIYRSPSSPDDNDKMLNRMIKTVVKMKLTHLVIAGDFNMPNIDWDTITTRQLGRPRSPANRFRN